MITSKVRKNQGFTLSLGDAFFEKLQRGNQINPPLADYLHPNEYSQELNYPPFPIELDRFLGGCNTLNDYLIKYVFRIKHIYIKHITYILYIYIKAYI